jgi:hypothetical protein
MFQRKPVQALAWVLAGAGIVTLAVVFMTWNRPAPDDSARDRERYAATSRALADAEALALLREVRDQLRSLEDTVRRLAAVQPTPTRIAVDPGRVAEEGEGQEAPLSSAETRELTRALRELTQQLARTTDESKGSSSLPPLGLEGFVDRKTAFTTLRVPQDVYAGVEGAFDAAQQRMRDDHYAWGSQDLVQAYGRPDEIWFEASDVACWHYQDEVEEGVWEGYTFYLKEGSVFTTEMDWWDESDEELEEEEEEEPDD